MALTLALVCIAFEALALAGERGWFGEGLRAWRTLALALGGFWPGLLAEGGRAVWPGQPAGMFFSYALLHAGPAHLLGNMAVLAWLGRRLEGVVDGRGFLLGWIVCAAGGAAAFALLSRGGQPMVGASAAIYGLVGLYLALAAAGRRAGGPSGPSRARGRAAAGGRVRGGLRRLLPTLVALALLELTAAFGLGLDLAWQAHLGGLATGLALGWAMAARRRRAPVPRPPCDRPGGGG
jgi:membrane associated rhomboid family serine protease